MIKWIVAVVGAVIAVATVESNPILFEWSYVSFGSDLPGGVAPVAIFIVLLWLGSGKRSQEDEKEDRTRNKQKQSISEKPKTNKKKKRTEGKPRGREATEDE